MEEAPFLPYRPDGHKRTREDRHPLGKRERAIFKPVAAGHYLKETPRVTTPPWKLEAWGTAHVSLEIMTALPDSTVMPPAETMTRAGPLIVTNRFRRWWQTCSSLFASISSLVRSLMTSAVSSRLGVPRTKATTRPLTAATWATSGAASCAADGEKPKTPAKPMVETRTAALVTFAEIMAFPFGFSPKGCRQTPEKALAGPPERQLWRNLALRRSAGCDRHHKNRRSATTSS